MRIYRYPDLRSHGIVWTRKHLLHLERIGKFPRRVKLGPNTVGYLADEIDRFVEERIAARDAEAA